MFAATSGYESDVTSSNESDVRATSLVRDILLISHPNFQ
jgi:hypothetical protein